MVHTIKTIEVILLENKKRITINEADFDPTYHDMVSSEASIPTAIDTYLKNKSEGKAIKDTDKKAPIVDTKKKATPEKKNNLAGVSPRKRIALR